jgi:hypothetical protein
MRGIFPLAWAAFAAFACADLVGADFDDKQPFSDASAGTGGLSGTGGQAGGVVGGSAGNVAGGSGGSAGVLAGGSGGVAGSDASTDAEVDSGPDVVSCAALTTPYPAGPYGNQVDDVFPPLVWEGFVNPSAVGLATAQPFGPHSMDAVRKTCKKYALIHNSEFTCPGCKNSADWLGTQGGGKQIVDAGGVVVEVLQSNNFSPANQTALETWILAYDLSVTSVIDAASADPNQTETALGIRETTWIVELETMTILNKFSGSIQGIGTPSAEAATPVVLNYLIGG